MISFRRWLVGLLIIILFFLSNIPPISQTTVTLAEQTADWPSWGRDLSNHRYNADESTITPANVSKLSLRWAFAFPDTLIASSQPTVIGDTVYIGSWNGK